ncbi:MAG: low molecular weight protein-tyrosine-phosphatase [Longimicrobiales bacterium]|nr:low molecular weight protein-tyrosine-phosphatase [Longimicrobiales bacterium]
MPAPRPTSVLFVCLGNICRSPLAEGVFLHLLRAAGAGDRYRVDSAGTGAWHVGERPDPRAREVAERRGVALPSRARQVTPPDLDDFDLVVAMDRSNLADLEALRDRHGGSARLVLLRDFDPEPGDREVPDPYYGGPEGFDRVVAMVERSARALLDHLEA